MERVRNTDLLVNGQHFRLGDIAKVSRGFADPPSPQMRVGGQPAIGIGVVMDKGGDVIHLGENLQSRDEAHRRTIAGGHRSACGGQSAGSGEGFDHVCSSVR